MPAYVVVDTEITNPEMMKQYAAGVRPTLEAHGGKVLASTDQITRVEGDWAPKRMVILEFADVATAQAWYDSPEYQAIIQFRLDATKGSMLFVEGMG